MENLKIHPLEEDYQEAIELLGHLGYNTKEQIYSPQQYQHLITGKCGTVWMSNTAQFNDWDARQVSIEQLREMVSQKQGEIIVKQKRNEQSQTYQVQIMKNGEHFLTVAREFTLEELINWLR